MSESSKPVSVAFVCLGNICRSPMAEAVFKHVVKKNGYSQYFSRIDSFGTGGWHVGDSPDGRSVACCKKHGVPINHRAQKITASDFADFDYIIAMDDSNLENLMRLQPKGNKSVVKKFGAWRTDMRYQETVDDPYYGGNDGFEINYQQITHFSEEFLKQEIDKKE